MFIKLLEYKKYCLTLYNFILTTNFIFMYLSIIYFLFFFFFFFFFFFCKLIIFFFISGVYRPWFQPVYFFYYNLLFTILSLTYQFDNYLFGIKMPFLFLYLILLFVSVFCFLFCFSLSFIMKYKKKKKKKKKKKVNNKGLECWLSSFVKII